MYRLATKRTEKNKSKKTKREREFLRHRQPHVHACAVL